MIVRVYEKCILNIEFHMLLVALSTITALLGRLFKQIIKHKVENKKVHVSQDSVDICIAFVFKLSVAFIVVGIHSLETDIKNDTVV